MYPSLTDLAIEAACRKAAEQAKADFAAGKPFANPYSSGDIASYSYAGAWNLEARKVSTK